MNNKELQFTMESEKILQEMHKSSVYEEHSGHGQHQGQSYDSSADSDSDQLEDDDGVFGMFLISM